MAVPPPLWGHPHPHSVTECLVQGWPCSTFATSKGPPSGCAEQNSADALVTSWCCAALRWGGGCSTGGGVARLGWWRRWPTAHRSRAPPTASRDCWMARCPAPRTRPSCSMRPARWPTGPIPRARRCLKASLVGCPIGCELLVMGLGAGIAVGAAQMARTMRR